MPRFSARSLFYLVAALAVLAGVGWLGLREPAQLARVQAASRGPITQVLAEEGKTRLKARYVISAPVAGTLRRVELQPGDAVQAGQPVAWIDPATSTLLDASSRARAEGELQTGESRQAAARQRIRAAQAAHRLARASLARATRLHEGRTLSQEALEQAQARAHTTAADLAAARADEQAAARQVQAARAVLLQEGRSRLPAPSAATPSADTPAASHRAEATLPDNGPLAILAPVSGVVLHRAQESSTPVNAGQQLLTLGDPQALELEAEVLSGEAVRLAPGMRARVLRWGGEGELQARVRRIEPGAFTKVSALGVEEQRTRVILDLDSPPERWRALGDGYRVELEFILKHEDEVLQVPAGALFRVQETAADGQPGSGGWALFRLEGDRARRTPVKTGIHAATRVQILEGIAEGDRVIIQPDERIADGTRIDAH